MKKVLEYLQEIENKSNEYNKPCFRGQSNAEWELKEGYFRNQEGEKEEYLSELYKRVIHQTGIVGSDNHINILQKLQHYGVPTRLLDWTYSPLISMFFACSDISNTDKNGVIYILKSESIEIFNIDNISIKTDMNEDANKSIMKKLADAINKLLPRASYSNFTKSLITNPSLKKNKYFKKDIFTMISENKCQREINQSSLFTINISNDAKNMWDSKTLEKITILQKDKESILYELKYYFNIWEYIVYPDNPDLATKRIVMEMKKK